MGKIDLNKIICINLKSVNAQQLFAICETYRFGFETLYDDKKTGTHMIWLAEGGLVVASVEECSFRPGQVVFQLNAAAFQLNMALTKKELDRLKKIKPVKTPKMPKTDDAINNYKAFLREGHKIQTKSLDDKIEKKSFVKSNFDDVIDEVKEELPVVLEVDAILEKILKYGIDSITKEEKIFLDNLNK